MTTLLEQLNMSDPVNRPPHYAMGRQFEVIDVIEDSVKFAPNAVTGGLQWQVLKYVHRCWNKEVPKQDLQKAAWYLNRLIESLED